MRNASKFAQMKFKDLLDVSLLDNGSFTLRESRFTVRTMIQEVVDLVDAQAKAQILSIDIDLSQINFTEVIGDANRIQQILLNILSNALKFSPQYGKILISGFWTNSLDEYGEALILMMIEIKDQGPGISSEDQRKIF